MSKTNMKYETPESPLFGSEVSHLFSTSEVSHSILKIQPGDVITLSYPFSVSPTALGRLVDTIKSHILEPLNLGDTVKVLVLDNGATLNVIRRDDGPKEYIPKHDTPLRPDDF